MPLPAPRPSPRRPSAARGFASLWRWFLPAAIVTMLAAILDGVGNPDARPAWLFTAGLGFALIGAGSLLRHLWQAGRSRLYDRDDPASRGPGR